MIRRAVRILGEAGRMHRIVAQTRDTQTPVRWKTWFVQRILGLNADAYWPVHHSSTVVCSANILAGIETSPGYMPGCYIQGINKIYIGNYTQIGPGVGLISANHDLVDNRKHVPAKPIVIGSYCWLGMHSIVLAGVQLGDFTVVAAGAVVTKSFEGGYCVLAGNPARVIRALDPGHCVRHKSSYEYHGYIPAESFEQFRSESLAL